MHCKTICSDGFSLLKQQGFSLMITSLFCCSGAQVSPRRSSHLLADLFLILLLWNCSSSEDEEVESLL